jgi:hypothetical protein
MSCFCFYLIGPETPGVIITTNFRVVCTRFKDLDTTSAPRAYESFVANVTHASSPENNVKYDIHRLFVNYYLCNQVGSSK